MGRRVKTIFNNLIFLQTQFYFTHNGMGEWINACFKWFYPILTLVSENVSCVLHILSVFELQFIQVCDFSKDFT